MNATSQISNLKLEMARVLTIAGSDSGGGAGIQGDLKTITALGGYGLSVVTALTAQNTRGVAGILAIRPQFVATQMEAVLSDIGADAVKTGMLATEGIVKVVARILRKYRLRTIVVDPVMISKSGHALLPQSAQGILVKRLLPLALLVTPNLAEASCLASFPVQSLDDMRRAARAIRQLGPRNVLVKGGHLQGDPVDVLCIGRRLIEIQGERIHTDCTHGAGCALASAIATFLAQGCDLVGSVRAAKSFVTEAMKRGAHVGRGYGVLEWAKAARHVLNR